MNLRQILGHVQGETGAHSRSAYTVLFNATKRQIDKWGRFNIKVINLQVEEQTGCVDWAQRNRCLVQWLDQLKGEIVAQRVKMDKAGKRKLLRPERP